MLGANDLGEALLLGLLVVVLVAVDEEDQVRVLLDGARLAEVGEDRTLVVPLLDRAGKLATGVAQAPGVSRSRASTFSWREIWETSWTRFSTDAPEVISWR